ncbi:hypothetical protein F7725_013521 [Dissostichus mawsoni]|uniref:G-protein coupled receptors family 1 profile domain-containing protein n=1 Tax=Dissostichus mawsoni TaxID=36200 RepID=A0A7J5Y481_DISMA|nr:hypothetical protein F7725_013521 [Dissostichus mawsoni]
MRMHPEEMDAVTDLQYHRTGLRRVSWRGHLFFVVPILPVFITVNIGILVDSPAGPAPLEIAWFQGGASRGPGMDMENYPWESALGPNLTNCTAPPASSLQAVQLTDEMAVVVVVVLSLLTFLTALINAARSARHAAFMVGMVWVISVFISMPPLFWRQRPSSGIFQQCIIEHDHLGYTIYSTFGAFYIPMIIILILYYRIYNAAKTLYQKRGSSRHLSSRSMGSQNYVDHYRVSHTFCVSDLSNSDLTLATDKLNATIRIPSFEKDIDGQDEKNQICTSRERKAAWILGLILGAFIICWLPFFIKELLVGLQMIKPSPLICDFLTWLGYINSLINPLLYTSFNDDFKLAFKKLLKRKEHA